MTANSGRRYLAAAQQDCPVKTPLGITRSGRPVWPITGAEPDDGEDEDDDDDDADDGDGDDDKDKSKGKEKAEEGDDALTAAEERAERYRKRMKMADRRAAEAERERDALKVGKKDGDDDGSAAVVVEKDKEIQTLSEANRTLRAQNAFLLNNTHQWHDPEDVMAMALKDEDLEIEEDGTVTGMAEVLKRLAKKKPWLVVEPKSGKADDDDDDDDDDDEDDEPPARRRTGAANGSRKKKTQVDRDKIVATYPALHRR